MQGESKNEKSELRQKYYGKNDVAAEQGCMQCSSSGVHEDEAIENRMEQQLYLHFQQMLPRSQYHNNQDSQYYLKTVSKQQITSQTLSYLTSFQYYLPTLSLQHPQQLLLLLNYFNNTQNITNQYRASSDYQDLAGPAKYCLDFYPVKARIDLEGLFRISNWHHVVDLSFCDSGWLGDSDWRVLVECAANFRNLKRLELNGNIITEIRQGDIEQFKSLRKITFTGNHLTRQSMGVIRRLKQKNNTFEKRMKQNYEKLEIIFF